MARCSALAITAPANGTRIPEMAEANSPKQGR
jgi:hypothetical protein